MGELSGISSVDRREEMARLHKAVKNVTQTSPSADLTADGELQNQPDDKRKRRAHLGAPEDLIRQQDDGTLDDEDGTSHSFDVTV